MPLVPSDEPLLCLLHEMITAETVEQFKDIKRRWGPERCQKVYRCLIKEEKKRITKICKPD
jgi:hypothetical protein